MILAGTIPYCVGNAREIKGLSHPPSDYHDAIHGCVAGFAVKMPLKLWRY